ncbi:MAG: Xaa-Pro dipeptidase [Pirellulaceae bacterium]|jgi:Xaa-Pro dipeptidase
MPKFEHYCATLVATALLWTAPESIHAAEPSILTQAEILHVIRQEKFDVVLPIAMRQNNVDMWIHVIRDGNPDPMQLHFGPVWGYIIFTDLGGDRIERAIFGSGGHSDLYDHFGSDAIGRAIEGYDYGNQDTAVYNELAKFIAERDPKRIALNTSPWLAVADGISHSQYIKLESIIGTKYSDRFISADQLITDFRSRRTASEIEAFSVALEMHRQLLRRALSAEVIKPGVSTLGDVGRWIVEEQQRQGIGFGIDGYIPLPRILYSAVSVTDAAPDVRWIIHDEDYVIQRGDFMTYDISVRYLEYFTTDFKRNAYVFRENEVSIPESIQTAFDRAIAAHRIMRPHIVAGRTAKQTLDALVVALENEDYVYTPFIDVGTEDYLSIQQALENTDRSGFSIDLHAMGNNGGSLVTVGASVAPFRTDRFDQVLQENQFFSFEYMVHTNLAERPGLPVSINIEGNHLITKDGVKYLHPPNKKILEIR